MERRDFLKGLGASVLCFQLNLILITKRKVLFTKRKEFIPPPAELCVVRRESDRADVGFISPMAIVSVEYELDGSGTWTDLADATSPVTIPGLSPAGSYVLRLRSRDGAGNVSVASSPLNIATTDMAVPFLDGLTMTVPYWYGLAKRRTAYTGKCVRVKNLTTNVQTDVDFDADGRIDRTALAGLVTGAQQLGIQKYYDQSGNGVDLTVVSGYHIIDLSGYRVGVITATAASPNNGYTSAATVNLTNPVFFDACEFYTLGQAFLFDHGSGNQFSERNTGGTASTTKYIYLNNGTAIQSAEPLTYGAVASDGIRIIVARFKAGDEEAWRDASALSFPGLAGVTNAGDTARTGVTVTLADFAGGGGLGWTGRIYEHGCLDGTYSGTEKATIEAAMRNDWQNGPLVIFFGDSLTYGTPAANPYIDGPAAKYKAIMPTGRDVCNRGYAGATIPNLESRVAGEIAPIVRSAASRVVFVINGGTNDAVSDSAPGSTIATRMASLISTLKALGSNVEVYLRTIPLQNAWPTEWADMQAANVLYIANWASWGADGIIDMTGDSHIGDSGNTLDTTYYDADEVHLTPTGYALVASYVNGVVP